MLLGHSEGGLIRAGVASKEELAGKHVVSRLTGRQREVLKAAVDLGYYQEPRGASHDEIAATVGLAETTVGEHLRKIEATVFSTLRTGASSP